MTQTPETQSHRFVVVYRAEVREISGADAVWRGWVERIPDPRQREIGQQENDRLGFTILNELPDLIRCLMERNEPVKHAANNKRRPQA